MPNFVPTGLYIGCADGAFASWSLETPDDCETVMLGKSESKARCVESATTRNAAAMFSVT